MGKIKEVDARGLACPQPVVETRKALEGPGARDVAVLVDSITSRDNVARFARSTGCRVEIEESAAGEYRVAIHREEGSRERLWEAPISCQAPAEYGTVVYVGCDQMGRGSEELGRKLMGGFLRTWIDIEPRPWRILFVNSGVYCTTQGSEVLDSLHLLEERGVEIFSCGTCLEYFGLKEKLKAGRVTNMYEIIETLNRARRVITPH